MTKVKITDIHEKDMHYKEREILTGMIIVPDETVKAKESELYPGWMEGYFSNESGTDGWYFFGVKFETVEEGE